MTLSNKLLRWPLVSRKSDPNDEVGAVEKEEAAAPVECDPTAAEKGPVFDAVRPLPIVAMVGVKRWGSELNGRNADFVAGKKHNYNRKISQLMREAKHFRSSFGITWKMLKKEMPRIIKVTTQTISKMIRENDDKLNVN